LVAAKAIDPDKDKPNDNNDKILLQDLKVITVYKDKKTNGRRSVINQVSLKATFFLKCIYNIQL